MKFDYTEEEIRDLENSQPPILKALHIASEKAVEKAVAYVERQRACEIIKKYIVPPDNDGYWANDLLKDIINQIRGE